MSVTMEDTAGKLGSDLDPNLDLAISQELDDKSLETANFPDIDNLFKYSQGDEKDELWGQLLANPDSMDGSTVNLTGPVAGCSQAQVSMDGANANTTGPVAGCSRTQISMDGSNANATGSSSIKSEFSDLADEASDMARWKNLQIELCKFQEKHTLFLEHRLKVVAWTRNAKKGPGYLSVKKDAVVRFIFFNPSRDGQKVFIKMWVEFKDVEFKDDKKLYPKMVTKDDNPTSEQLCPFSIISDPFDGVNAIERYSGDGENGPIVAVVSTVKGSSDCIIGKIRFILIGTDSVCSGRPVKQCKIWQFCYQVFTDAECATQAVDEGEFPLQVLTNVLDKSTPKLLPSTSDPTLKFELRTPHQLRKTALNNKVVPQENVELNFGDLKAKPGDSLSFCLLHADPDHEHENIYENFKVVSEKQGSNPEPFVISENEVNYQVSYSGYGQHRQASVAFGDSLVAFNSEGCDSILVKWMLDLKLNQTHKTRSLNLWINGQLGGKRIENYQIAHQPVSVLRKKNVADSEDNQPPAKTRR